jgi:HAD superfamily hydrolase (TIGR01459 family)
MEHLSSFVPLADRYQGFILDLWGVIHDGVTAFPHAILCLERLRDARKGSLLVSNAPRPNTAVQALMRSMGLPDDLYTAILTSGEAVRSALRSPPDAWWATLGQRVFLLGPHRDRPILDGLPLISVSSPKQANFVLNTGPDDQRNPTDINAFEDILQACLTHRLPMVCANPDLEVIRGGVRVLCAGALAARYQALGGDVRSLGKPDPAIYDQALELLGIAPDLVLVVGDALRTDIAGASGVGLASCWVLSGIHGASLARPDGSFDTAWAEVEARLAGLAPIATIPRFAW